MVSDISLVKEAKLGLDEEQREEIFGKIMNFVNEIQDKKLSEFVAGLLFESPSKKRSVTAK